MQYTIFTIYDVKAEAYHLPFYQHNQPMAVRMFVDACNDENSSISKHPEDYALFEMGTFDDAAALFTTNTPKQVMSGLEAVALNRKRIESQRDLLGENNASE